jgi:hypothetical protein
MRGRLFVLALLAAASVLPTFGSATAVAGDMDRVVGGARDAFDANVAISARSGPSGEDAFGHNNATLPFPGTPGDTIQVRLRVTCLAVAGNLAAAGAVVTDSASNDVPPGTNFVIVFRDTGLPGGDGDAVEPFFGAPAATCSEFVPLAAVAPPIRNGNIHVHDASA